MILIPFLCLFVVLASPTLKLIPPMGLAMLRVGIALPFLFFVAVHVSPYPLRADI